MFRFFGMFREPSQDAIISALATGAKSGAELSKELGVLSGWLYPALMRLERQGTITSEWADGPYPRRRLYQIA